MVSVTVEYEGYAYRFKVIEKHGRVYFISAWELSPEASEFLQRQCESNKKKPREQTRAIRRVIKAQRKEKRLMERVEKNRAKLRK